MAAQEILPGVHVIQGKFAGEFGFISTYLLVDEDQALVIDPGTAGYPGESIVETLKKLGLSLKSDITAVACTHGHPDHVGGANRLKRVTEAPILIHKSDAELLEDPSLFFKERLRMDFAKRMAMKMDKGPLRVNYTGLIPDKLLTDGDTIRVGKRTITVIHTGGHSAGHCVFLDKDAGILFSGDELNNFPNDPRKFYTDLSGSLTMKLSAIERLRSMNFQYLFPSHDIAHLMNDARLQLEEVYDGTIQFQETILSLLSVRGEADIDQLVLDVKRARSVPYPTTLDSLLPTTIEVTLHSLKAAGLVSSQEADLWTTS
ncbi:MAG: MBL fold metallo-hydrolase [Candidatus Thorarchaeota archaeon]